MTTSGITLDVVAIEGISVFVVVVVDVVNVCASGGSILSQVLLISDCCCCWLTIVAVVAAGAAASITITSVTIAIELGTISAISRFICLLSFDVVGRSSAKSTTSTDMFVNVVAGSLRLRCDGLLEGRFRMRLCCSVKALTVLQLVVGVVVSVVVVTPAADVVVNTTLPVVVVLTSMLACVGVMGVDVSHFVLCKVNGLVNIKLIKLCTTMILPY